jgi:hypothetical protein
MKINFGLGPNASCAGPRKILKFRPVQTSSSRSQMVEFGHHGEEPRFK